MLWKPRLRNKPRHYVLIFLSDGSTKLLIISTRRSAIAERPRDALCQLKSCQLLHSCTKNHIWKRLVICEWPWKWLKVIGIASVRWAIYHFLLVVLLAFHSNYVLLLRFWYVARYWSTNADFNLLHMYFEPPFEVTPSNFTKIFGVSKLASQGYRAMLFSCYV